MELFEGIIPSVHSFLAEQTHRRSWASEPSLPWPAGGSRNIVLKEDLGVELGNPEMESVSCLLWTENLSWIEDKRITLVGHDFFESAAKSLPFGKVVLVGVESFDEDNVYERHKNLDFLRYDSLFEGFHDEGCFPAHERMVQDKQGSPFEGFLSPPPRVFAHEPHCSETLCEVSRDDLLHLIIGRCGQA